MDTASDDPRHISDQSEEHNAEARGAQVELSPEEREEKVKSAAPDGGEIQDVADRPAADDQRDAARSDAGRSDGARSDAGENGSGQSGSRVSVVDERPAPPEGVGDGGDHGHTNKVYPTDRPATLA